MSQFSIQGHVTGGQIREIKPGEAKQQIQDGKDQIYVKANGKDYVIEGESLDFKGLNNSQTQVPSAQLKLNGQTIPATIQHIDNEAQGWKETIQQTLQNPTGWGKDSQIAGTFHELQDVLGNQDRLWNDESKKAGDVTNALRRNPLVLKALENLSSTSQLDEQVQKLTEFRLQQEANWGQSVTNLDVTQLKDGELFAVQKTLALTRMDRSPADVTEGFVTAAGTVNGHSIDKRELFWQRYKPVGEPSGKLVVMFPGFLQTSQNFHEQVTLLNRQGHDVLVMDQQWAGQTKGGKSGGVDRGYGITRDVAVMAAYANTQLEADYGQHPGKELILMGTSLGGGPGVIGALTMNQNHKLEIEGPAMPQNVKVVLQGPFFEATDTLNNTVFNLASKIPLANQIPLPSIGLPVLTSDPETAQKLSQGAVMEDLQARLQAMTAVAPDMQEIMALIEQGKGPQVPIQIIHSKGDPLASAQRSEWISSKLPQAQITLLEKNDHVLEQHREEQQEALKALGRLKP